MKSLYDELRAKAELGTSATRRNGPKIDIGLLLMNYRDDLRGLWIAADACARSMGELAPEGLRAAVEKLRPFFGERP